jgi:ABC-type dipeptide/oligopeptide/nickel transport system ATPase component
MEDPLARAISIVSDLLADVTSHNDFQRRKISYYAVATHFMRQFGTFPGLAIYGPSGSGKTATLYVVGLLCRKVVRVTSTAITAAALKDAAIESNDATLMIEEGEEVSAKQLEEILLLRYDRSSAWVSKMVPSALGSGSWTQERLPAFGATIMHRDHLFKKPQLQRRMIPVKTRLDIGRKYADYRTIETRCEEEIKKFRTIVVPCAGQTSLSEVLNPSKDISQGIFDCYRPLVAIAEYLEDADFYWQLVEEMKEATERLKEDVSDTDMASILRVIIALVNEKTNGNYCRPSAIMGHK